MNRALWWIVVSALEEIKALIARHKALDALRAAIRGQLTELRRHLGAAMPEAEVYKVLFPLVIYCDELVLRQLADGDPTRWPQLQAELYQIRDGGEAFYRMLDEELEKSDMLPALDEVLYYCLNDGFLGRLGEDPLRVKEYQDRLAARIQARARRLGGPRPVPSGAGAAPADGEAQAGRSARKAARAALGADGEGADADQARAPRRRQARRRQAAPPRPALLYYVGAAVLILATPALLLWLSNL